MDSKSPARAAANSFSTRGPSPDLHDEGPRLLKMVFDTESALIIATNQYQDIENTARDMFRIPKSTPIVISAEVPSLSNEKLVVHRIAWPSISKEVSTIWIQIQPNVEPPEDAQPPKRSAFRTIRIEDWTGCILSTNRVFTVQIPRDATIAELKEAIQKHDSSRYPSAQKISIRGGLDNKMDTLDESLVCFGRYMFFYRPSYS